MNNWKECFEKNNILIYCKTENEAYELLDIAHQLGYRWSNNDQYTVGFGSFDDSGMVFDINDGTCDSYSDYLESWYFNYFKLIDFDTIKKNGRIPFKLIRKIK